MRPLATSDLHALVAADQPIRLDATAATPAELVAWTPDETLRRPFRAALEQLPAALRQDPGQIVSLAVSTDEQAWRAYGLAVTRDGRLHRWGDVPLGGDATQRAALRRTLDEERFKLVCTRNDGTTLSTSWVAVTADDRLVSSQPGYTESYPPAFLAGVHPIKAIIGDAIRGFALTEDGYVRSWFCAGTDQPLPDDFPQGRVRAIAGSFFEYQALLDDGTVYEWWRAGVNDGGFVELDGRRLDRVREIAGSTALREDGSVVAWLTMYGIRPHVVAGLPRIAALAGNYGVLEADGTLHLLEAAARRYRKAGGPVAGKQVLHFHGAGDFRGRGQLDGRGVELALAIVARPRIARLAAAGGIDGQQAAIGRPFAQPLRVQALDAHGEALAGRAVRFSVRSLTGSCFDGAPSIAGLEVVTDAAGFATPPLLHAGPVVGPVQIELADADGGGVLLTLQATVIAARPATDWISGAAIERHAGGEMQRAPSGPFRINLDGGIELRAQFGQRVKPGAAYRDARQPAHPPRRESDGEEAAPQHCAVAT